VQANDRWLISGTVRECTWKDGGAPQPWKDRGAPQPRSELVSVPVRSSAGGHSPAPGSVTTSYSGVIPVAGSSVYMHANQPL
jgi:hypothetical protein